MTRPADPPPAHPPATPATGDPATTGPATADPRGTDSQAADPRGTDPDGTDPQPADQATASRTPRPAPGRIAEEILRRTAELGSASSICPSEVARGLDPEHWRRLLGPVRQAAAGLAREGRIDILRKGKPVAPEALHGVIRLRAR